MELYVEIDTKIYVLQSSQSSQGIAYSIEHRLVRGSQEGNFKNTLHFWKLNK